MMNKELVETTFYQTMQRVDDYLQISSDRYLICYIDRNIHVSIGCNLTITNTFDDQLPPIFCLRSRGMLYRIDTFNLAYNRCVIRPNVKVIMLIESTAGWTPFEKNQQFLD